jgi:hypothetical protein
MFGNVPISVIRPPSSEPNDIGISSFDTGVPVLRSSWKATGMNIASAPMFFTRAETSVTEETSTTTWRLMVVRNGRTPRNRTSTTPDRATAALTTSAEAPQLLEIRRAQMLRQIAQHHDADRLVCSVDDGQSTNLALLHFGDRLLHRIVLAADEQG